jgi:hypothetical protein
MAEPYSPWAGLQRGSPAYQELKDHRAEALWGLIDQVGCLVGTGAVAQGRVVNKQFVNACA